LCGAWTSPTKTTSQKSLWKRGRGQRSLERSCTWGGHLFCSNLFLFTIWGRRARYLNGGEEKMNFERLGGKKKTGYLRKSPYEVHAGGVGSITIIKTERVGRFLSERIKYPGWCVFQKSSPRRKNGKQFFMGYPKNARVFGKSPQTSLVSDGTRTRSVEPSLQDHGRHGCRTLAGNGQA